MDGHFVVNPANTVIGMNGMSTFVYTIWKGRAISIEDANKHTQS